ncbi:hypothetical protein BBBOND_0400470 [Babesia bigemina]|uniref:Uncharacterized protein n=1 Tax=Babesia bigemina TaxID=5866 RepID=A0A061DEM8_BABBI|nr:hypothetical protein BBBOND_0400470 [Babesia bigemina]CDR97555.1 hypothetical protein BBBOND_0400470 [Babesia bigemina]|eukprot:XP_012769741.1 hypothetical protein BBBOND_0400470 [Babesia bigemina]
MKARFVFSTLLAVVAHHQVLECFAEQYEMHNGEGDTSLLNEPYDDSVRNEESGLVGSAPQDFPLYSSRNTSLKGKKSSAKLPESTMNRTSSLTNGRHILQKMRSKSAVMKSPSSNDNADEKKVFRVKKTVEILIDAPTSSAKGDGDAGRNMSTKSTVVEVPDSSRSDIDVTAEVPSAETQSERPVYDETVVPKSSPPEFGMEGDTVKNRLPQSAMQYEDEKTGMVREDEDGLLFNNGVKELDYSETMSSQKVEPTLEPDADGSATYETFPLSTEDGYDSQNAIRRSPVESDSDVYESSSGMVMPHHRSSNPLHPEDGTGDDEGHGRRDGSIVRGNTRVKHGYRLGGLNEPSNYFAPARYADNTHHRGLHKGGVKAHHRKRSTKKHYNKLGDEYLTNYRSELKENSPRRKKMARSDSTGDVTTEAAERSIDPESSSIEVDVIGDDNSDGDMTNEVSGVPVYPQMLEKEATVDTETANADVDEDTMPIEEDSDAIETSDSPKMESELSSDSSDTVDEIEPDEISDGTALRGLRSKGRKAPKKIAKPAKSKAPKKNKKKPVNKRKRGDKKAKRSKRLEKKRMARAERKRSEKAAKQAKIAAKKSRKEAKKAAKDVIVLENSTTDDVNVIAAPSETAAPKSTSDSPNDGKTGSDGNDPPISVKAIADSTEKATTSEENSADAGKGPADSATSDNTVSLNGSNKASVASFEDTSMSADDTAEGNAAEKDNTPDVESPSSDEGDEDEMSDSQEDLDEESEADDVDEDDSEEVTHL